MAADTGVPRTIARLWRGATAAEHADTYLAYLHDTGIVEYRGTPGNRGVLVLRRVDGGRAEFLLITLWESEDAVRRFAGDDVRRAVFYPEDDRFLIERGEIVEHYQVAGAVPAAIAGSVDDRLLAHAPVMKTGMLVRRPAAEVFEAFVNPDVTTKFWFTKSTGRLEAGRQVQWEWEMYGISVPVTARVVEPDTRIVIEWPGYGGLTAVEWLFAPQDDGTTFVTITESGFTGSADELVKQVTDSTQGFSLVLAGVKALLEHGIRLNLVPDRYPKGIAEH